MISLQPKVLFILLLLALPIGASATQVNSSVAADQVWRRGDSPVEVTRLIAVEREATLTIEAGVTVRFSTGAGIIINGNLRADGTPADQVVFTSAEGSEAGSWGGLFFRNPASPKAYDDQFKPNGQGSWLVNCVLENGGNLEVEGGSVLTIQSAAPYVGNSTIRNSKAVTGTIRCLNSAEPLFVNCSIVGNVSARGGALSSGVSSKPRLIGCSITGNEATDNGGAIYVSLADISITGSIINGNKAGTDGGAIFAVRAAEFILIENVFEVNRAGAGSNVIVLNDRFNANIKGNTFEPVGTVITLQKAIGVLDVSGNYWGNADPEVFKDLIHDRNDDGVEPLVTYLPTLFAPSRKTPVNPSQIDKIFLCRNDSYADPIPRGVASGAPLRIRLDGKDANPGFADAISVTVASEIDNDGIQVTLHETGINTGVYTGLSMVAAKSDQKAFVIGSQEGGSISIWSPVKDDLRATYNTLTPKPVVADLAIIGSSDNTHLTKHMPTFSWSYYEPIDRPQRSYKIEVDKDGGNDVWNSGEIKGFESETIYDGRKLEDGESYKFQIVVNSGKYWSDSAILQFRMNSLPSAPIPMRPEEGSVVPTRTPQLATGISSDREGDALTYSFEIDAVSGANGQQAKSELNGTNEVVWTPGEPLVENATYHFRGQAADPFEVGAWGKYQLFYVNSLEEAPLAFDVSSPVSGDVYDLHPTLEWSTAVDADPLSNVVYGIEIAKGGNWPQGRKYEDIFPTSFRLPDSLENKAEYQWRVTATDNTARKTMSSRIGKFRVDTTPTTPTIIAPKSGEERKPEPSMVTSAKSAEERIQKTTLNWSPSTDPNPNDVITYEIEVFKDAASPKVLANMTGWSATEIATGQLQGWESLNDNTIYQWRVKARDNHNAASEFSTSGSFFNNSRNDTPTPPASVTAPSANVTGTTTVTFGWTPGTDADMSDGMMTLMYEVDAVVGTFETGDVRHFRSNPGDKELSVALDDNRVWKYHVRTVDDDGAASAWTSTKEVLVNAEEDAPTPFALANPTSGETVAELDSIRLFWSPSSDPDWNSSIKYRLELTGADGKTFKYETSATEYLHKVPLANESTYTWKVTAIDNTSRETVCVNEFSVRTNTTPTSPTSMEIAAEILPNGRISWGGSSDPNPRDRFVYTLDIASDESFAPIIVHKEGIAHGTGTISVAINELTGWEKLLDDKDYYFRVKATDNHGFSSEWMSAVKFRFNLANDNPTVPIATFSPSGGITISDRSPVLMWGASTDEDLSDPANSLIYEIRIDADGEVAKNALYEFSTAPGATEFRVPMPLGDNSPWVWVVRSKDDGAGVSPWSPLQSVLLNVQEDSPSAPVATKPYNSQTLNVLGPVGFGWMRSTDADYKSSLTYRVEYGTSATLSGATESAELKDSTFSVAGPLENTTYYWRVIAKDNTGLETKSSIASFILDTRPTMPQAAMPAGGVELKPDGRFAWSGSADPNPADVITYTMQIASDAGFGTVAVELTGLKETTVVATNPGLKGKLADNEHYYWRVKATDNHKIESAYGSAVDFIYNEKNDAPSGFSLKSPSNGSHQNPGEVKLSWGNATDPDPGSKVSYTLMFARDTKFSDRAQRFTGLAVGEFTVPGAMIEAGATYYWKVSAEDGMGGTSFGSDSDKTPWSFVIDVPPPPPAPVEAAPVAPGTGG